MWAGQSIEYGTSLIYNETLPPAVGTNRLEFSLQNWDSGAYTHVAGAAGAGNGSFGWVCYFQSGPVSLACSNSWSSTGLAIPLSGLPTASFNVRLQHDITNKYDSYEAWDSNGVRFFFSQQPYTTETDSGEGFQMGNGNEPTVQCPFMRAYSTLVPVNSTPPTTRQSTAGQLFEWKFEGDLSDSSGNGNTAIYTPGSPTYTATQYQEPPISVIANNPLSWTNITSARAGYPMPLSGAGSYSQADASAAVTYFWQQISGPSQLVWPSGHAGVSPAPVGASWGDYQIQLTVTDVNGNTDVSVQDIGMVAQDSKGVVVNADLNADALIGNMIAFGKNPWGYADYWQQFATHIRYPNQYWPLSGPQWEQTGAGTVSYVWGGTGGATLTGNINATTLSIPISDASLLDFTSYPTRILLGTGPTEEIRICSSSATSGPATLTACYDGRGQHAASGTSWSSGQAVIQAKVTGTSTLFVSDPNSAACPSGAPNGITGLASYSVGTATITAGSATMTGSGTAWLANAAAGQYVRIAATHSSTTFEFIAQISTVNSDTSITLSRAYPSDADTLSGLSYAILPAFRTIDLRGPHIVDTNATGEWIWNASGCESETALYLNPFRSDNEFASGHDIPANNGRTMSGYQYSVTDSTGYVNEGPNGGIDFYGEDLSSMALCLRSGQKFACDAWHTMSNYMTKSPWGNLDGGGFPPLFMGGLGIAGFASAVLGAGSGPGSGQGASWGDLRSYAQLGVNTANSIYNSGTPQCWNGDTRDNAYAFSFLILGALYDPNPTFQNQWLAALPTMQADDAACHLSDFSWSNGFLWNNSGSNAFGPVTLTHNSTAVTGSGLASNACIGTARGTGTIVNGSSTLTITGGSPSGDSISITGTLSSAPFSVNVMYSGTTLSVLWPGDTGAVTWMSINTNNAGVNMTTYATSNADTADLQNSFNCVYNSSSSLTLDHPWPGSTGGSYFGFFGNIDGYGQQPFYNGINDYRIGVLSRATAPALGSLPATYLGYANGIGGWIKSTGFNMPTLTTNYGRGYQFCEPAMTASATGFDYQSPGCNYSASSINSETTGREQNAEISNAFSDYYINNTNSGNMTWGNQAYGAIWGNPAYNTGGVYFDAASAANNLAPTNLNAASIEGGKWYGFFSGMGMLHRWPAVRLGGVAPPDVRTVNVPYSLTGVTGASKVEVTVTEPTGIATSVTCTSSPCTVSVDYRQGNPNLEIDVENSGGSIIAKGDPVPWHIVAP